MEIDKQAIYKEKVAPLVDQIAEICGREGIPTIMAFHLTEASEEDEGFFSVTGVFNLPGMIKTPVFALIRSILMRGAQSVEVTYRENTPPVRPKEARP